MALESNPSCGRNGKFSCSLTQRPLVEPPTPVYLIRPGFQALVDTYSLTPVLFLTGANDWVQTFQSDFSMIFKYAKPTQTNGPKSHQISSSP